jgi:hypothetical protein
MKRKILVQWSDEGLSKKYQTFEKRFSQKEEEFKDPQLEMALSLLRGEEIFIPIPKGAAGAGTVDTKEEKKE